MLVDGEELNLGGKKNHAPGLPLPEVIERSQVNYAFCYVSFLIHGMINYVEKCRQSLA